MAKTKISEYSSTANSNTDIASINIDEGCAPSGINNAIRALMAQLKDFQTGAASDPLTVGGVLTVTGGSASAPAITTSGDTNTGVLFPAADTVGVTTGGTERVRVNSSGNVGIGVTPSAWGNNVALQLTGPSLWGSSGVSHLTTNTYYDGTNYKYIASNYVTDYYQLNGTHVWRTAASGTAGNNVTLTESMRIDSSGNVGIGTSSPSYKLDVSGETMRVGNSTAYAGLQFGANATSTNNFHLASNTGALIFYNGNYGAGTERMRIDSSGDLLVGTTSNAFSSKGVQLGNPGYIFVTRDSGIPMWVNRLTSTGVLVEYSYNSVVRGTISTNGSSVSYNTSSDYRLKHDIAPMTGALAKVALLKPCTYKWNADDSEGEGFIAHELAEVVPQCVTGKKDAVDAEGNPVYQGIDTSFLVATLTAAIQELKAELDAAKADIAALKGTA